MKILLVAATPFEVAPLKNYLEINGESTIGNFFKYNKLEIEVLITGVGMMQTAFWLGKVLVQKKYDLVLNAGVAGAFDKNLKIGEVVNVVSEKFGDLGAENIDGSFLDIFEMELLNGNEFPFFHNQLNHPLATETVFLPKVNGLTVNKVHGEKSSIEKIKKKYKADVETMEGAAFFYACVVEKVSFFEIRAISNYVEPRNRANWNLDLAIKNLNETLVEIINSLG